jgi:hypothetical protein
MNTSSVVQVEEGVSHDIAAERLEREAAPQASLVETWLLDHLDLLAFVVVATGFVLRIFAATRTYLNPDEALHYLLLNQSSAWLAYKASLTNAHPPLVYLVVYYWHFLGRSEWMLRMPSVLAGTAFCWFLYNWMGLAFGRAVSWIGLILAAFAPSMVALSAELRAYPLLLFCMSGALYYLERAFAEKSVRQIWVFSAFLYLAILSHYSAAFFAAALGVYVLARIADSHLPRKVILAWAAGQAGALAIYAFLYVTHLSKLKSSIGVWSKSFGTAYFQKDSINLFTFTWQNTYSIFNFLFGQRYFAVAMEVCFVGGVLYFFATELLSRRGNAPSNRLGILLLFPFICVWCASMAGIYPYIGSRHTAFLAPFAIAAVSFSLASITDKKIWIGSLVAILLMLASTIISGSAPTEQVAGDQSPASMASAVNYMEQSIPRGDHFLLDYQSSLPFELYFCGPKTIFPNQAFQGDYFDFACKGESATSIRAWKLIAQVFPWEFQKMARSHGLKPGDRVWLYQTGWGVDLASDLATEDPKFQGLTPRKFGSALTVTGFVVGRDFLPEPPSGGR